MNREEVREKLIKLVEPLVESRGFELVQLEYIPGKKGHLQLFIDRKGGITVDHCELVSNAVSDLLDYHDPIDHTYTLEVSSPGLERPLTKKEHFDRFAGEKVKIKTTEKIEGRRNYSVTLEGTGDNSVFVKLEDGSRMEIPMKMIEKANLWYTKADKDRMAKGGEEGR